MRIKRTSLLVYSLLILGCNIPVPDQIDPAIFKNPPFEIKLHAYWQWMDGAITTEGITRDLEAMHDQGITQATILNVSLFDGRDLGIKKVPFASDPWFEMFYWALKEANRLGITIGMHNSDGWSGAAGPWITPEMSMKKYIWSKTIERGGQELNKLLIEPGGLYDFYRDEAVLAIKTSQESSAFQRTKHKIIHNNSEDASALADGCPISSIMLRKGDTLDISLADPLPIKRLAIFPYQYSMWGDPENFEFVFSMQISDDGIHFRNHSDCKVKGSNKGAIISFPEVISKYVRLILLDSKNNNYIVPANIGEIELLHGDERPLFSPGIPDFLEKAAFVRSKQDQYYSRVETKTVDRVISRDEVLDLTQFMDKDGVLKWEAPPGRWTILRIGYTTTGNKNNPASPEGIGLECDKLDTSAVNLHFANFPARLAEKGGEFTGNTFKFILLDSWESDYQNWTLLMPEHFEKNTGYSMLTWFPVLCGEIIGTVNDSESFLYDFRKTIAKLLEESYYKHNQQLCHRNGLEFHSEVIYGNYSYPPIDIISANRYIDMPMTEFWTAVDVENNIKYSPSKYKELHLPVSASRVYDIPVTGAEAYTGLAHFSESLFDLKPFGDRAFCEGINQIILHSYVHQPDERKPGITLGRYASHFNRHNLYWPYMKEWIDYQSRLQYVLQEGSTVTDVLYYLGDQMPQFNYSNVSNQIPPGYTLTACNFDVLKNRVKIVEGKILLNNQDTISLMSMPPFPFMNLETLSLVEKLVKEGLVLFSPKPEYLLSGTDYRENLEKFKAIAERLWGEDKDKHLIRQTYGKGKILWGMTLKEALEETGVNPDFSTGANDSLLFHFIHKKAGDTDLYFVANQLDSTIHHELCFRVTEKIPEIWDPVNGKKSYPAIFSDENGLTRIPVTLEPYESLLFVFKPGKPVSHILSVSINDEIVFPGASGKEIPDIERTDSGYLYTGNAGGNFIFKTEDGNQVVIQLEKRNEFRVDSYSGTISFEAGYPAKIPELPIDSLRSLTSYEDEAIRYFSGNAHYTMKFSVPVDFLDSGERMMLDIGEYFSAAKVSLNGSFLGSFWGEKAEIDVSKLIVEENELKVTVTNEYRNRFIGDFRQYGGVRNLWTSAAIGEFLDANKQLSPSGWMGPVKISSFEVVKF